MSLKILVTDDEADIRTLLTEQLEAANYEPMTAPNGATCLAMLKAGAEFDLILLDMKMPQLNGLETLAKIRMLPSLARNIPVIMLTGFSDRKLVAKAVQLGANDYLVKPWSMEKLFARIQEAVKSMEMDEVRQILSTAHLEDSEVLSQTGMPDAAKRDYSAYPVTFNDQKLCILVRKPGTPARLHEFKDKDIVNVVQIFRKTESRWKFTWPTMKQVSKVQDAVEETDEMAALLQKIS